MANIITPPYNRTQHALDHANLLTSKNKSSKTGLNKPNGGLKIIPLGDSITQQSSVLSNGVWQFGSGYAETLIAVAGPRFKQVSNAGISGQTSAQILSRLQSDVLSLAPDICMILAGTNDYQPGMTNSSIATLCNNIETMVVQCLLNGILPLVVVPPPKNSAAIESRKCRWFYYRIAQFYNVPLIDLYTICVDASTGNYNSSYSSDGTHPNVAGIAAIVSSAKATLQQLDSSFAMPYFGVFSETSNNNFSNLLRNGSFSQITTPPTPDSWSVNSTGAVLTTTAAVYPYSGKSVNYVKSSAGGAYALYGSSTNSISGGDKVLFSGRISSTGRTTPTGLNVTLDLSPTGSVRPINSWLQDGDFTFAHEFTIPNGTTSLTPTVYVSDVGTYLINNLTVFNITTADAIWSPGNQ